MLLNKRAARLFFFENLAYLHALIGYSPFSSLNQSLPWGKVSHGEGEGGQGRSWGKVSLKAKGQGRPWGKVSPKANGQGRPWGKVGPGDKFDPGASSALGQVRPSGNVRPWGKVRP